MVYWGGAFQGGTHRGAATSCSLCVETYAFLSLGKQKQEIYDSEKMVK